MSKLGNWRDDNWYWDQGWSKREVLALLRANWKQRRKVKNEREKHIRAGSRRRLEWADMLKGKMRQWQAAHAARDFAASDRLRAEILMIGGDSAVREMQMKRASLG